MKTTGRTLPLSSYASLDELTETPLTPPKTSCNRLSAMSISAIVATTFLITVVLIFNTVQRPAITKEQCCQHFLPASLNETSGSWEGTLIDLFSPDDINPSSRRFIDFHNNELEVSASTGTEKWGRRFYPDSSINPVLLQPSGKIPSSSNNVRTVSFISKISSRDTPIQRGYAEHGALNFTLTMGTVLGRRMLRFNGLYDGSGGPWVPAGEIVPPSECDNFWEYENL